MDEKEFTFAYVPVGPHVEPTEQQKIRSSERWSTYSYDSTVTMVFAPPRFGWFYWIFHGDPRGNLVKIDCSEVFDPCPDIVQWMNAITAADFPARLKVDEEGQYVNFSANPIADRPEWIELEIVRDHCGGPKGTPPTLLYFRRVERRQLVSQFGRRWTDWLRQDYVAKEWHQRAWTGDMEGEGPTRDPATLDLTTLRHFVGAAE